MDFDEIEAAGQINLSELGESFLQSFCKKAATSFFEEYGLISHQLNSYNFFIEHGLQNVFNSFGEMLVEPSFDPTKNKETDWRYATVKFGEVTVEKPTFFSDDKELEFLPWHARLQNMTYSARMKVNVQVEVLNLCLELMNDSPHCALIEYIMLVCNDSYTVHVSYSYYELLYCLTASSLYILTRCS